MTLITKHLSNTTDRFLEHLWNRATYLIRNRSISQSSVWQSHEDGILPADTPILMNLLDWWCKWTNGHRFGIFHEPGQDKATCSYYVVSLIGKFLLRGSWFSTLKAVPFGHTTFARTFWVAAYAKNHLGYFDLERSNNSEVSLYTAAVICGWVSFHL